MLSRSNQNSQKKDIEKSNRKWKGKKQIKQWKRISFDMENVEAKKKSKTKQRQQEQGIATIRGEREYFFLLPRLQSKDR